LFNPRNSFSFPSKNKKPTLFPYREKAGVSSQPQISFRLGLYQLFSGTNREVSVLEVLET
jgi:hypothetical protein